MSEFKLFFVGWKSSAIPTAAEYICEREVPKNYSKPDTIAAFKQKAKQEQLEEAAVSPVTGMVTELCIVNAHGATVLRTQCDRKDPNAVVARELMAFLESQFPGDGLSGGPYQMYGFNIKIMLRMAGLECLGYSARNNNDIQVRPSNWVDPKQVYDPYERILGAQDRKDIDLYALGGFLQEDFSAEMVLDNTEYQANVCRRLVDKAQLCALL